MTTDTTQGDTFGNVAMKVIAVIHTDFPEKFGIPRQSGLIPQLRAYIVFEKEYRDPTALRGIEDFSHLWLLWHFSRAESESWSPTVRPPLLGGNRRMGVFATRSPFRPNPIGLSSVKLLGLRQTAEYGTVLLVEGADLMDGTPIFDIKPYLPFTDCRADATGGFTEELNPRKLRVTMPPQLARRLPADKLEALTAVLAGDPRPSYHDDPQRVYGMGFAGYEIKFTVSDGELTVTQIQ